MSTLIHSQTIWYATQVSLSPAHWRIARVWSFGVSLQQPTYSPHSRVATSPPTMSNALDARPFSTLHTNSTHTLSFSNSSSSSGVQFQQQQQKQRRRPCALEVMQRTGHLPYSTASRGDSAAQLGRVVLAGIDCSALAIDVCGRIWIDTHKHTNASSSTTLRTELSRDARIIL